MRLRKSAMICLLIAGMMSLALCAGAASHHTERWYQTRWCSQAGGEAEVVMSDGSRCDCVTATHAIEFDFGHKWAESIGQSLHYGSLTGLRPGVVLILETESDARGLGRLEETIGGYDLPIDVWSVRDGQGH